MYVGDVRVVQCGERLRLAIETNQPVRIAGKRVRQDLEGNIAAEPGIARSVDDAHAALAQLAEDLVVAEGPADHRRRPMAISLRV